MNGYSDSFGFHLDLHGRQNSMVINDPFAVKQSAMTHTFTATIISLMNLNFSKLLFSGTNILRTNFNNNDLTNTNNHPLHLIQNSNTTI
jgi:hypothetical protein